MNLTMLLYFIPLIFAGFLVYHLIFKVQLPGKGVWAIISYIIGAIIIFILVGWLITSYLGSWMNNMLNAGSNPDWQQFVVNSENIVRSAFGAPPASGGDNSGGGAPVPTATPIQAVLIVTATPYPGGTNARPGYVTPPPPPGGNLQYTVQQGDTLYKIASENGVSVDQLMLANGLTSYVIIPGQVLTIPQPSQP